MTTTEFATFDVAELDALDATDAVALPDMGASILFVWNTDDGDEVLGDDVLNGSVSVSTSSSSS
jgi:hypothetical protein